MIAVRPRRVVLSDVDSINTLLAQIGKATYVGTHMEYQLAKDLGELFAMSKQVDKPWSTGDAVGLSFMASGPVVLRQMQ